MKAAVYPLEADQAVTWDVDKPEVATISADGLLTAKGSGFVIVTATASNGLMGIKGIQLKQIPTSISLSGNNIVEVGGTLQFTTSILPENSEENELTWLSGETSIAMVNSEGVITGVGQGTTYITATSVADSSVMAFKSVTVVKSPVSVAITPSTVTLDAGGSMALTATVLPDDADNKTVTWSSDAPGVAKVNSSGVVTVVAPGTAQISATTVNGKTAKATITVRQPYTLVFNANGGSCGTASVTVYSGYAIGNVLPTPTRANYSFLGWYTAATGGTKLTSSWSTTCTTSYTVYAHWSQNTCKITFNGNGGTASLSEKTMNCGDAIGTLPTGSLTNYSLDGWYTAASGGTQVTTATAFSADTTLYAHWSRIIYTVTFNANGGTCGTATKKVYSGDPIGTLPTPTRDYYTFNYWYYGSTTVNTTTVITSNLTVYANWTEKPWSSWYEKGTVTIPAGARTNEKTQ